MTLDNSYLFPSIGKSTLQYYCFCKILGPGRGRGGGASPPPPPNPLFEKKKLRNKIKKYAFRLWWNKNIRLADLAETFKFIIGSFLSFII